MRSISVLSSLLFLFSLSCAAPPSPGGEGEGEGEPAQPIAVDVEFTGETVAAVASVDGGAILTLTSANHTYVLDIGPEAVSEDVEITMEEVTIPALGGAPGVRFSPAGLVFAQPAVLTIDVAEAPGEVMVGLLFEEGVAGVEEQFAAPTSSGYSMLVPHFSTGTITGAATAAPALTEEQRRNLVGVESARQAVAKALADRYVARIEPDIARGRFGVAALRAASRELSNWKVDVDTAGVGNVVVGNLPGQPTLGALFQSGSDQLAQNLTLLYRDRTAPKCERGREVFDLRDFARVVTELQAIAAELIVTLPANSMCVSTELIVSGTPTALTSGDNEVRVSAELRLVGFDGTREPIGPALVLFDATGATGPTDVTTETGVVPAQVFTRPSQNRPLGVKVVVTAVSSDIQLGALPEVAPQVFQAQEPLEALLRLTPSTLSGPGTVELCALASARGASLDSFGAKWSLPQPIGSLSTGESSTTTGESCVIWTSPDPLPETEEAVAVLATVTATGASVDKTASIRLRGTAVISVSTFSSAVGVGGSSNICATVMSDNGPLAGQAVRFTATNGTLSELSAETDSQGKACVTFTGNTVGTAALAAETTLAGVIHAATASIQVSETPPPPPPSPCTTASGNGPFELNASYTQVIADARAISSGSTNSSKTDTGVSTATVEDSGMDFTYSCTGSASSTVLSGNCSHTEETDTMSVSAIAQSEMQQQMVQLQGRGSGIAKITAVVSGEILDGEDGSLSFNLEFDPDDNVGRDSTSINFGGGSGPRSVQQTLTLEVPFDFNLPTMRRVYRRATLSVGADAHATATVTLSAISIGSCNL